MSVSRKPAGGCSSRSSQRLLSSLCWTLLLALPLEAREVELQPRLAGAVTDADAGSLVVVRVEPVGSVGGADRPTDALEVQLHVGESRSLDLQEGMYWSIRAEADGFWHAEVFLDPEDLGDEPVVLRLHRLGEVRFEVLPSRFGETSDHIEVGFAPPPTVHDSEIEGVGECSLEERVARCQVPIGRHDLRVSSPPWTPAYHLGVEIQPEEATSLEPFELVRGSSISGFVTLEGGDPPPERTRVVVVPAVQGPEAEAPELRAMRLETSVGERGFFQLAGLRPSAYRLVASAPGYAPSRIGPIEARPDLESALLDPLVLRRPSALTLQLDPPTDPWGESWEVDLSRISEEEARTLSSVSGEATADGSFYQDGLSPGQYQVALIGSNDTRWYWEELEVGPAPTFHTVVLPLIQVEGEVARDEELVNGTLWFGTHEGVRRVSFEVVDGEFEGLLPSPGHWPVEWIASGEEGGTVELRPIEVPDERYVELRLELPATEVVGAVVDSEGRPVSEAEVRAVGARTADGKAVEGSGTTDDQGRFRILGLEPGAYGIRASRGKSRSVVSPLTVSEDLEGGDVRLVLQEELLLFGSVTSRGRAVAGARVLSWPTLGEAVGASIHSTVTGPNGEFEIATTGTPGPWVFLVSAPSFAVHWGVDQVSGRDSVDIALDRHPGTLIIESAEGALDSVLLVHAGAFLPVRGFVLMAFHERRPRDQDGALVIDGLEPGEYALCDARAVLAGGGAPGESCSTGVLAPYGELRLSPPAASPSR